jgi:N-acetylmuramoyl-L-alanine amidase
MILTNAIEMRAPRARDLTALARAPALASALVCLFAFAVEVHAVQSEYEVTLITESGTRSIPISEFGGKAMVPLDPIASLIDGVLRPSSERGRVTLTANGSQAQLADGQNFVPVKGKMELLSSPVRLVSGSWFVPLDFLSKIVPELSAVSVSYRPRERWLIMGDSFPVLEVRSQRDPTYTRVEVETSQAVPLEVNQTEEAIHVELEAPYLQTDFQQEELLDGVVERISLERMEGRYRVTVRLGERFGTLKAYERGSPARGIVLDLLRSRVPGGRDRTQTSSDEPEIIGEDLRPIDERGEPADPETLSAGENPTGDENETESGVDPLDPNIDPESESESESEIVGDGSGFPETINLPPDYPLPGADPGDRLERSDRPARLLTITLDPGHGGAQVGATGPGGNEEKSVVLSIARRLQRLLNERLGLRVLLTRDGDRDLSHDERAALANNNKSDLFISIHADASPRSSARGSSVYFLSYGSQATQAGAPASAASGGGGSDLDFILWDMVQASHLSRSSRLAEILQEELLAATGEPSLNRGIKQNRFRVLKGAAMPAVLVEVGFISNAEEEQLLSSPEYQLKIAEALFRGVVRFKDLYESGGSEQADRSQE